jgi:Sec-independent protein secretion pathway component TatC
MDIVILRAVQWAGLVVAAVWTIAGPDAFSKLVLMVPYFWLFNSSTNGMN